MPTFTILKAPSSGTAITVKDGRLIVPDDPIVPFIEGDGTGPDIWRASVRVFDAAVAKAFGGTRRLVWFEVPAGEKANKDTRRVAAERHARSGPRVPGCNQGAADDAGGRWHPKS